MELNLLGLRELQKETARALTVMSADNHTLSKFNKLAPHDSQEWYRTILKTYIAQYGDLPSIAGPGKDVKLIQS